jgi:hypothetical protein
VFCRLDNLNSYALGWLKSMYHYEDSPERTEDDLRDMLAGVGGNFYWRDYLKPGPEGYWWRAVELFLAERDGDTEKVAYLTIETERQRKINEMKLRAFGVMRPPGQPEVGLPDYIDRLTLTRAINRGNR